MTSIELNLSQLSFNNPDTISDSRNRSKLINSLFAQLGPDQPNQNQEKPQLQLFPQRSRIFSEQTPLEKVRDDSPQNFDIEIDCVDQSSFDDCQSIIEQTFNPTNKQFGPQARTSDSHLNVNCASFCPQIKFEQNSSAQATNFQHQCAVTQADSDEQSTECIDMGYANISHLGLDNISCAFDDSMSSTSVKSHQSGFKLKEKTEICKNWLSNKCRFGDQCSFAHGYDQIQKKSHCSDKYKLTRCKGFHEQGYCPYGERCQFAHVSRENVVNWRQALEQNILQFQARTESLKAPNFYTEFNIAAPTCKRLPIFEQTVQSEAVDNKDSDMPRAKKERGLNQRKKRKTKVVKC